MPPLPALSSACPYCKAIRSDRTRVKPCYPNVFELCRWRMSPGLCFGRHCLALGTSCSCPSLTRDLNSGVECSSLSLSVFLCQSLHLIPYLPPPVPHFNGTMEMSSGGEKNTSCLWYPFYWMGPFICRPSVQN